MTKAQEATYLYGRLESIQKALEDLYTIAYDYLEHFNQEDEDSPIDDVMESINYYMNDLYKELPLND